MACFDSVARTGLLVATNGMIAASRAPAYMNDAVMLRASMIVQPALQKVWELTPFSAA